MLTAKGNAQPVTFKAGTVEWTNRWHDQGHADGPVQARRLMYVNGDVAEDDTEAARWFRLAAGSGANRRCPVQPRFARWFTAMPRREARLRLAAWGNLHIAREYIGDTR